MNHSIKQFFIDLDNQLPDKWGVNAFVAEFKHTHLLFITIVLLGLLAYAYDIFQFTLHIDSEIDAYRINPFLIWIREGRWGVYLLSAILLPTPVIPVIPVLIAVLGYSVGIFFFLKILSPHHRSIADYLTALIAMGCPIMYFAFYWQSLAYPLGIGFAAIGLGMYQLRCWTKTGFVIATISFCFAMSIYQALIPVILVIYGMYLVSTVLAAPQIKTNQLLSYTLTFCAAMALAYGLYSLISQLCMSLMHQSASSAYMNGFVNFAFTPQYITETLPSALHTLLKYYTGDKLYYYYESTSLYLLFYICLLAVCSRILILKANHSLKIIALVIFLFTLMVPALMLMMNAGDMPVRTMFATVFVLAGLIFIASSTPSNLLRSIILILSISCYVNFVITNHRYAFSSHLAWEADREFSTQLLNRINQVAYKLPPRDFTYIENIGMHTKRYPLEIVGVKTAYPESPLFVQREAIGASFYTWVPDEVRRQVALLAVMGNFDFWPASRTERRSIFDQALKMPVWPNEGSVDVINGVVVIKFGDYHPDQLLGICSKEDDTPLAACQQRLK